MKIVAFTNNALFVGQHILIHILNKRDSSMTDLPVKFGEFKICSHSKAANFFTVKQCHVFWHQNCMTAACPDQSKYFFKLQRFEKALTFLHNYLAVPRRMLSEIICLFF